MSNLFFLGKIDSFSPPILSLTTFSLSVENSVLVFPLKNSISLALPLRDKESSPISGFSLSGRPFFLEEGPTFFFLPQTLASFD